MSHETTKQVPLGAFAFRADRWQFAATDQTGKVPVALTARSGDAIDHWFWGRTVHDLAGLRLHKPTLPIDYAHNDSEVIGYLDEFSVESGDLVAKGALVPYGDPDTDRAAEVKYKADQGIPWEASIFFDPKLQRIEEVAENVQVQVNGRQFTGPLTIFREWQLRGVAICPYGADANTPVRLKNAEPVPVTVFSYQPSEGDMPKKKLTEADAPAEALPDTAKLTDDATPTAEPVLEEEAAVEPKAEEPIQAEAVSKAPTDALTAGRAECQRFVDAFGLAGAQAFARGESFAECQARYLRQLEHENEQLKAQLSAKKGRGDATPVAFDAADDDGKPMPTNHQRMALGDNLARVAAGMRLTNHRQKT